MRERGGGWVEREKVKKKGGKDKAKEKAHKESGKQNGTDLSDDMRAAVCVEDTAGQAARRSPQSMKQEVWLASEKSSRRWGVRYSWGRSEGWEDTGS